MDEFEEFARCFRARTQAKLAEFEKLLEEATRQLPQQVKERNPYKAEGGASSLPRTRRRGPVRSVLKEAQISSG